MLKQYTVAYRWENIRKIYSLDINILSSQSFSVHYLIFMWYTSKNTSTLVLTYEKAKPICTSFLLYLQKNFIKIVQIKYKIYRRFSFIFKFWFQYSWSRDLFLVRNYQCKKGYSKLLKNYFFKFEFVFLQLGYFCLLNKISLKRSHFIRNHVPV